MTQSSSSVAVSAAESGSPQAADLGLTMTRIFKIPLAALRASMESLDRDLPADDPRREVLAGALSEIRRLGRDVEALADYAAPRPLQPLRCSIEELLQGAIARLSADQAARVSVARPARPCSLTVDGPLFASALAHLVQLALESSRDDVLLQARAEGDAIVFAIVESSAGVVPLALSTQSEQRDASLGLGFNLARRDVLRMGGELSVLSTARGHTCIVVHMRDRAVSGGTSA